MNSCLWFLLGSAALLGSNAEVFTCDGVSLKGEIIEFSFQSAFKLETEPGKISSLEFSDIYLIQFACRPEVKPESYPVGIALTDGSILVGEVRGGDEQRLLFMHPLLGGMNIPFERLSTLVSSTPSIPEDLSFYPRGGEEDVVYKKGPHKRGKDYIQGTIVEFTSQGLVFDCRLGELTFDLKELEALTLAQYQPPLELDGAYAWIVLRKGSGLLRARIQAFNRNEVVIATVLAESLSLPYEKISSIAFEGGRYLALSDMDPVEKEERSYIQGEDRLFLYPYKRDRSVTGRWLVSGGQIFARGLGIHSRTRLTYCLDGKFQGFETHLGLSDEVLDLPAKGSIRLDLFVDEKKVYSSPVIRGGDGIIKTPLIDLNDASRLSLLIDFADGFDSGDRAILGNPVLVRRNAPTKQ